MGMHLLWQNCTGLPPPTRWPSVKNCPSQIGGGGGGLPLLHLRFCAYDLMLPSPPLPPFFCLRAAPEGGQEICKNALCVPSSGNCVGWYSANLISIPRDPLPGFLFVWETQKIRISAFLSSSWLLLLLGGGHPRNADSAGGYTKPEFSPKQAEEIGRGCKSIIFVCCWM